MEDIRAIELYSGIGGMHFALKKSCPEAKVVAAVDINPNANKVYAHNFPEVKILDKGIEGFCVKKLDALKFNAVLMSPPCQPFTRIGLQKDTSDPRSKSFLHFLSILPNLARQPKYILLENVKGFEVSEAHAKLCETLNSCKYQYEEFLLSPRHLGIPNSRLRYFLLAKKEKFHPSVRSRGKKIWETLPLKFLENPNERKSSATAFDQEPNAKRWKRSKEIEDETSTNGDSVEMKSLEEYLEDSPSEEYKVPEKVKSRYVKVMDIVRPESTNSACFTKSYTQYAEATGSVLNLNNCNDNSVQSTDRQPDDYDLRYFTPREVANLMCFPKHFNFSQDITRKQRYKLLGNSLNVAVVSYLISLLLLKDTETDTKNCYD